MFFRTAIKLMAFGIAGLSSPYPFSIFSHETSMKHGFTKHYISLAVIFIFFVSRIFPQGSWGFSHLGVLCFQVSKQITRRAPTSSNIEL